MNIEHYTDRYFLNAQSACRQAHRNPQVLYQVFQRGEAVLCGMPYVRRLLAPLRDKLKVEALEDGASIAPLETVMHIAGPVVDLFPYETVCIGLLARMTRIATNVKRAVQEANGKPVLFFPARFDVPEVQEYDGYAAHVGGASGASTGAGAGAFHKPAVGTMPHALIAAFEGNTVRAAIALREACPNEAIWALVDFENDSARTSVEVLRAFQDRGWKLSGVRLDTSQSLVDEGLHRQGSQEHGVTPSLVRHVRRSLNENGGAEVKIAVSGGFTSEKIRSFEEQSTPVDVYALGESLFHGSVPFTADIVGFWNRTEFVACAKQGRSYRANSALKRWS